MNPPLAMLSRRIGAPGSEPNRSAINRGPFARLAAVPPHATGPGGSPGSAPGHFPPEVLSLAVGPSIRVLIVDDHAVVRTGLRTLFDLLDDIEVVGEAADGSAAVAAARRLQPDVVLMDLLMPNMDGLEAIAQIKREWPAVEIVAMTSFVEQEKVTAALEAGASGYLLKDAQGEDVARAVRTAHAGDAHLHPAVTRMLAQRMREPWTYVSNSLGKLGLASRTQAALDAVEHRLA